METGNFPTLKTPAVTHLGDALGSTLGPHGASSITSCRLQQPRDTFPTFLCLELQPNISRDIPAALTGLGNTMSQSLSREKVVSSPCYRSYSFGLTALDSCL